MLGTFTDQILKKEWAEADIQKYVGFFLSCHLSYATKKSLREKAASGGITTALLIYGLENNYFDGAVVCKTSIEDGKVRARFNIATSKEELLASQGSKYVETSFLREALPLIKGFDGRLAVVGLPCDISALKHRGEKEPNIKNKVVLSIALVCGHNSRKELIDGITRKLNKENNKQLTDYRFRVGHWRGNLEAEYDNGQIIKKESKFFNDYQNLHFFSEKKCMACSDHYGYNADISVGDVWLFKLKKDPIKHSGVIIRTERGNAVFSNAESANTIFSTELDVRDIMDGQSRIGPSHYNVSARHLAGKLVGIKLKDSVHEPVSWHHYLSALMTMINIKISESRLGSKLIFFVPRSIWKFYLYLKKGLESLK